MGLRQRLCDGGEYLAALLVILECRSIYAQAVEINFHISGAAAAVLLLLLVLKTAGQRVHRPLLQRWAVLFLLMATVLLSLAVMSVPQDRLADFVLRFVIVLPAMILLFCIDREEGQELALLAKLSNVMVLLAVLSLVFWVLASQLHLVTPTGEWNARWLTQSFYTSYFGVYFECLTVIFLGYSGFRNTGIFCEPAMYSLCMAVALIYELFLRETPKAFGGRVRIGAGKLLVRRHQEFRRLKILLFSVTIVTTFSTSGIVLLFLLLFLKYAGLKPRNFWLRVLQLLSLGAVVSVVALLVYVVFQIRIPAAAWNVIVNAYTEGLRLWESSPLFGTGYAGSTQAAALLKSNSFFAILAEGGLALFAVYLIPLAGAFLLALVRKRPGVAVLALAAGFELLAILVPYTYMILLLLAYCFSYLLAEINSGQKGKNL